MEPSISGRMAHHMIQGWRVDMRLRRRERQQELAGAAMRGIIVGLTWGLAVGFVVGVGVRLIA